MEADALAVWHGEGAAVERLEPGTQLWADADEDASNRIAWRLEEDGTVHRDHLTCAELLVRAR